MSIIGNVPHEEYQLALALISIDPETRQPYAEAVRGIHATGTEYYGVREALSALIFDIKQGKKSKATRDLLANLHPTELYRVNFYLSMFVGIMEERLVLVFYGDERRFGFLQERDLKLAQVEFNGDFRGQAIHKLSQAGIDTRYE